MQEKLESTPNQHVVVVVASVASCFWMGKSLLEERLCTLHYLAVGPVHNATTSVCECFAIITPSGGHPLQRIVNKTRPLSWLLSENEVIINSESHETRETFFSKKHLYERLGGCVRDVWLSEYVYSMMVAILDRNRSRSAVCGNSENFLSLRQTDSRQKVIQLVLTTLTMMFNNGDNSISEEYMHILIFYLLTTSCIGVFPFSIAVT